MGIANSRWSRKIAALLHDPPDKPFGIAGHKDRAAELQRIALKRDAGTDEVRRAERADRIASAADRVNFPEGTETFWHQQEAVLTHPLAGRELGLGSLGEVSVWDTHEAAKKVVESLARDGSGAQVFLRLWRCLPDALATEFPRVGALFGMLPADTRQPDHPLLQHLSITAAIADSLPQPALLVFSIGPVQEFIAAARRTQDLWMGSWLLSYLSWTAMRSIAETYGPDVVLYPSLRGQPLCDFWLVHDGQVPIQQPCPEDLALASLPNKFVALLPASEARAAAGAAEQAVRSEWKRLTDAVFTELKNGIMPADDVTRQMWAEQVKTQLEVYWSVLAWPGGDETSSLKQADTVKLLFENLCRPDADWLFGRIYQLYAKTKAESGGQYEPNWGTTYSLLYTLADRAFNARKSLRDFTPTEERGEKCTVCGQRAALHGKDGSRGGVRAFWAQTANNLKAKKRHAEIKSNGRERLCAICTIKRFIHQEVLEEKFSLEAKFPSTSEVTIASLKAAILEKLPDPQHGEKLAKALREHLNTLQLLNFPATVAGGAIPKLLRLRQQMSNVSQETRKYADKLLSYDGEAFFFETFTPKHLQDDYDLEVSESGARSARESLQALLHAAKDAGIPGPSKYYAVLMMDGDYAGRWLSGTHEGLITLGKVLHPTVRQQLEALPEWKALLNERRLITPAVHAAISDALANFALKLVRFVVEERHAGRVVYAGGDDVLALLPLDEALVAAQELRALFSGEIGFGDENLKASKVDVRKQAWHVKFSDSKCTGYLWLDGAPLLTMGPTATASIGIAIAHHLQPLDIALHAMRQAEHAAKEVYGRDALCVHLLKRSGEEVRVGGRWFYPEVPQDTITLMMDICRRFQKGKLAMRLARAVAEEARILARLPEEAQRAELKRLLKRHSEAKMNDDERNNLAGYLTALSSALDAHAGKAGKRGFEQMADWLLLACFLAKGGEE
jgi:CRISPR-associated protein Cmr2